jgi:hypothetical protein
VELWLWKHTKHQNYLVDAYDSTARLVQVLDDPGSDLDLLLVDAVLTDKRGGLEALEAADSIRPHVPAVLYSAFESKGARFMYGLAAAAWFGRRNLKAIYPKVASTFDGTGSDFVDMVTGVLDGTYRCPTLSTLLDASIDMQFDQLIGPVKEMRFWKATMNHASKSNAVKALGISDQKLTNWQTERQELVEQWWDDATLGQATGLAGAPAYISRSEVRDLHTTLHRFAGQQPFFEDEYVYRRAGRELSS